MGRTSRGSRDLPHPRPVERIELSEKHIRLRWIAVVLLAVLGIGSLTYSFMRFLGAEPGWTVIEGNVTQGTQLCEEFTFQYLLGAGGQSASRENKEITALYTQAAVKAYQVFENVENEESHNLFYINRHPNEEISVDEVLYRALELYAASGDRSIYLAPVYEEYSNLFSGTEDWQTYDFDPFQNPEAAEYYREIAAYAGDPEQIRLELLGGNTVRLYVSGGYLKYAGENGIESFIDLMWMKNAFVVDYFAEVMTENGYTQGVISSYDGFTRNLDNSGEGYGFRLYDRRDGALYSAGVMQYSGPESIVFLRSYPINSLDSRNFYQFSDGRVLSAYLDVRDGLCRSSVSGLVCYAKDQGCAELLLQMIPVYIADFLDEDQLPAYSIFWCDDTIYYNDPGLILTDLYEDEQFSYKSSCLF